MKGYIYLIENKINEKKYVGKTYLNIEKRWKQHCNDSKRFNRPLYQAMKKYGIENFSIKEIEYCDNLEEREKYWISFYDSYHNTPRLIPASSLLPVFLSFLQTYYSLSFHIFQGAILAFHRFSIS